MLHPYNCRAPTINEHTILLQMPKNGRSKGKKKPVASRTPMQNALDELGVTLEQYVAVQSHKMPKNCCVTPAPHAHGTPAAHAHGMPAPRGRSSSRGRAGAGGSQHQSREGLVHRDLTRRQIIKLRFDSAVLKYKNIGGLAKHIYSRQDLIAKAIELYEIEDTTSILDSLLKHLPGNKYHDMARDEFPLTYENQKPLNMKEATPYTRYRNQIGLGLKRLHDVGYAWDKQMSKFNLAALIIQKNGSEETINMNLEEYLSKYSTPSADALDIAKEYFPKYSTTTEHYAYREFSARPAMPHSHTSHEQDTMPHARASNAPQHYRTPEPDSLLGPEANQDNSSYESRYIAEQVPDEYRV